MEASDRISKAVGDGLWALAAASLAPDGVAKESEQDRIEKALCVADCLLHPVSKEWDEAAHPRGNGGRFGNGSGGAGPTREAPAHWHERRAVLRNVPAHALHDYFHRELRGQPAGTPPNASWDRGTYVHQILLRERAQGIVHGEPAHRTRAEDPNTLVTMTPMAPAEPSADPGGTGRLHDLALHNALTYFNERASSSGTTEHASPSNPIREELLSAGLITPGNGGGHVVTSAGSNLWNSGASPREVGAAVGERVRSSSTRDTPAPAPAPAPPAEPAVTPAAEPPSATEAYRAMGIIERNGISYSRSGAYSIPDSMRDQLTSAGLAERAGSRDDGHRLTEAGRTIMGNGSRDGNGPQLVARWIAGAGSREAASEPQPLTAYTPAQTTSALRAIAESGAGAHTDRSTVSDAQRATLVNAGLIEPRIGNDASDGHRLTSAGTAMLRGDAPAANPVLASDDAALHGALSYFNAVAAGTRSADTTAVDTSMRERLLRAGVIEPYGGGVIGHRINNEGHALIGGANGPSDLGNTLRAREADIATGRLPNPMTAALERAATADRDRATTQAAAREAYLAQERARVEAEARRPGRTPATAVPVGEGSKVDPPRGTKGLEDGTYVLREPKEGRTPTCARIPLTFRAPADAAERALYGGEKVPTNESLEKVWGHAGSGVSCKITSASVAIGYNDRATGRYEGRILKGGRQIGQFSRRFTREDGRVKVDHSYFKIENADDQGGGAGAAMIGQGFMAYREMGFSKITVHPEWVGPYAWAALGYNLPEHSDGGEASLSGLREKLVPFLKEHGIPEDKAKEHAANCLTLGDFADLNLTPKGEPADRGKPGLYIHHVSDETNSDKAQDAGEPYHPEYDLHLGARFLLSKDRYGGNWHGSTGTIQLDNPMSQSFKRVVARTGAKP